MNWEERLANAPRRLPLEGGEVELLGWYHEGEIRDNVPHRHTFYEVCLVGERGGGHFIVEGVRHEVGPGDVFFARPGVVHQILNKQRRGMELYWLSWAWRPRRSEGTKGDIGALMEAFAESGQLVTRGDGRLNAAWRAVCALADGPPWPAQEAQLVGAMTALVLAIAQSGAPQLEAAEPPAASAGTGELAARAAVRYIADNLDGDLSSETLAAQLHLSVRHLARVFSAFTGIAPSAYVERARLHRAADLLRDTPLPVKEIAARVGYSDVRYFSRRFALLHGAPPAAFRRGEGHVRIIQKPGALV